MAKKTYKTADDNVLNMIEVATNLLVQYDEFKESIQASGGDDITDEQIDGFIGSEEQMGDVLSALITLKKVQANRRMIAEREEKKIMIFVKRIMNRLDVKEWKSEDGKAKGKVKYRREYEDAEKFKGVPKKFFKPVYGSVNSFVQKKALEGKQIKGIILHEGNLSVSIT